MYEKCGLMVKITNPEVISYLRSNPEKTNTSLVEDAMREMLCIPPKTGEETRKTRKLTENQNAIPVKISDQYLIDYICTQKQKFGVLQRHTVETAVLRHIERVKNESAK